MIVALKEQIVPCLDGEDEMVTKSKRGRGGKGLPMIHLIPVEPGPRVCVCRS